MARMIKGEDTMEDYRGFRIGDFVEATTIDHDHIEGTVTGVTYDTLTIDGEPYDWDALIEPSVV